MSLASLARAMMRCPALSPFRAVVVLGWILVATLGPGSAYSHPESHSEPQPQPQSNVPDGEAIASADALDPENPRTEILLLPRGELFEPLVADPHWPRFSAEYQWRLGSDQFDRVGAVSFGESFAIVRSREYAWGEWEFGIQANIDAIFDMTRTSFDLSNEDYVFGLTGSFLMHGVTTQLRVYHLSSHVGDEYLIENGGGRDDVSFEVLDILLSYEPRDWLRVYGGGGVLVNSSASFDPVLFEMGMEWTSPISWAGGVVTPIAALDCQVRQQNDWIPDVAIVTGLRIAKPGNDVRRIEIVARYYNGRSPDGQFFREKIESLGLGFRLGF